MNQTFKYKLLKQVIPKDTVEFINEYFLLKRRVFNTMLEHKIIPPYLEHLFGQVEDCMVRGTDYAMYGDLVGETLLKRLKNIIQENVNLGNIVENYSFVRIYKKGNVLKKHKDRGACECSATIPIGGSPWPFFIEGKQFDLIPGDVLIYNGFLEHWRNKFEDVECVQMFIHYNSVNTLKEKKLKPYDGRLHIGLPSHLALKTKDK